MHDFVIIMRSFQPSHDKLFGWLFFSVLFKAWPINIHSYVSLSTKVLNSRNWSEIVWLPEISRFKNQPCNRCYSKNPIGMHWLGYYDVVSWLNEAKTRVFQPTANFENFEIYLYFVCLPACQPASLP